MTLCETEIKVAAKITKPDNLRLSTGDPTNLWMQVYSLYVGYDTLQGPVSNALVPSSLPEIVTRSPDSFDKLLSK